MPKTSTSFSVGNPGGKGRAGGRSRQTKLNQIRKALANDLPRFTTALKQLALDGDMAALKLCLQYLSPPAKYSEVTIENAAELANLPADRRIEEANRLAIEGRLPVEHAELIINMASSEIHSGVLKQLRHLKARAKAGAAVAEILQLLGNLTVDAPSRQRTEDALDLATQSKPLSILQ